MKMFRLPAGLIALLMLGLVGCSTQSPDFTAKLLTFSISPSSGNVPLGDTFQFTPSATCSTPPGSAQTTASCTPDIQWTVQTIPNSSGKGTISNTGLFTGTAPGDVDVVASAGGISSTAKVTVGPGVIKTLVVTPATASIGQESSQNFLVQATYSDSPGQTVTLRPGDTIEWAAYVPNSTTPSTVATVSPTTGSTTTASSAQVAGTVTITACTPTCAAATTTGSATLTVTNQRLIGLSADQKLTPPTQTIPAGIDSAPYQMIGTFSDGTTTTTGPINNTQIDWTFTPADGSIATLNPVDATGNSVTMHGVALGQATLKGTLKAGVAPSITDPTKRFETGTLSVLQGYCTVPYAQPAATTTVTLDPLCLGGLLCSVTNPNNVIDSDPGTFASLNSTVGLLFSGETLQINSGAAAQAGGTTVGFVIARPAGLLLSAEVLSQFTVQTLLGTANPNTQTVQETFNVSASTTLPPLLRLTLLGTVGGVDQVLVSFDTTASKDYDGLSIKFNPGVAGALETTNIYSACANIDKTKLPPPSP